MSAIASLVVFAWLSSADAQEAPVATSPPPAAPSNLRVIDTPDDNGSSLNLHWDLSTDDASRVSRYQVLRASAAAPDSFEVIGETTRGQNDFAVGGLNTRGRYLFRVVALSTDGGSVATPVVGPVSPAAQWLNIRRAWILAWTLLVCGAILYYIREAQSGKPLFVRRIAGIEAVDDAIGRATEMGRKVMFVPGSQDMDDVQTIAGITILGRVAKLTAQNNTQLDVPVSRSLVMVTAREAVREAYQRAGRPDAFHEDMVHYVTDDQFGYAAAISGAIVRDRPATLFYMGCFYAESLILAETGTAAGAIQIAGTGQPTQLPFFVAACDYTLLGEELFAASAYLSHEPRLLGSLKGQDFAKAAFLIAIVAGVIAVVIFGWSDYLKFLEVS